MSAMRYTNPVIPGDWSDPGVVRVGEDYDSVRSTFGWQPGLHIAHSRDLIHWRYIGFADTSNAFGRPDASARGASGGRISATTRCLGSVAAGTMCGPEPSWACSPAATVPRPPAQFWATTNFWAPEVHRFNGRYYMLASFKADQQYRGTQILVSDVVSGPYVPLTERPVTPPDWECLDGTLHVDAAGNPWMAFCHEWVQVHNGAMYAMRLSPDLKQATPDERPVFIEIEEAGDDIRIKT